MNDEYKKRYYLIGIRFRSSEYHIPSLYSYSTSIKTFNLGFVYVDFIFKNAIYSPDGNSEYIGISWIEKSSEQQNYKMNPIFPPQ